MLLFRNSTLNTWPPALSIEARFTASLLVFMSCAKLPAYVKRHLGDTPLLKEPLILVALHKCGYSTVILSFETSIAPALSYERASH